jgi:eukaryotic-like serine/threonine-protein kinase
MSADISFLVPGGALTGALFARLVRNDDDERRALAPDIRVGNYRIVDVLGRGGSSIVYRAQRADGTYEQTVALKVMRSDPRFRAFLKRERNILGQLGHPGVARILDGGETDAGEAWYAMELVAGERIDAWCNNRHSDWRGRVELMVEVCETVQYAHAHLVVHRDLKPSNILVDDSGFPRLLDFGISREVDEDAAHDDEIAFTPGFASPEQIEGAPAHTASDIFQLGRLLQLLLEGVAMPLLVARNLRAVVARATETQAEERYAAAAALRADLLRALNGYPAAAAWTLLDRVRFYVSRNARALGVVAAAGLLVGGLAAYYTRQMYVEHERTRDEMRHAQVVSDVLANVFRTAAPSLEQAERISAAEILDRGTASALRRLADAPQQRAIAVEAMASTYLDLSGREKAQELLDKTLAELDAQPGLAIERARLHILRGRVAASQRHAELAERDVDAAALLLASLRGYPLDEANLEALRINLLAQRQDGRSEAERRRAALMLSMQQQGLGDTPTFATLLSDRSQERAFGNDYAGARADLMQALAITRAHFGPVSPQALRVERDVIFLSLRSNNGAGDVEAERLLAAQHQAVSQSFGEKSLEFSDVLMFEGIVAGEHGNLELARQRFEQSLSILRAQLGPDAAPVAVAAHNLGDAEIAAGQPARALLQYSDALRIRLLHKSGADDQPTMINRLQIARAQCELGQYQAANAGFVDARRRLSERLAPTHAYLAVSAALQVDCLLRQRDTDAARALFDQELTAPRREALSRSDRSRVAATEQALAEAEKRR